MKDNRKTPFISDMSKSVQTSQGTKKFPVASYVRFNNFSDTDASNGSLIKDSVTSSRYEIVEGVPVSGGLMTGSTVALTDFGIGLHPSGSVYGQTVYTNVTLYDSIGAILPMRQRGLSLPLSGVPAGRKLAVKRSVENLNPSVINQARCFMLKIRVAADHNNQALLSIGEPGSGLTTFCISFDSTGNIAFRHKSSSGSSAAQTANITPYFGKWLTVFVNADLNSSGKPRLGQSLIYDTVTGALLETANTDVGTGTAVSVTDPNMYIGYGEPSGGVNVAFALTDYLNNVDVAELTVFSEYISLTTADMIARSHLNENHYRSGFNNRSPRITQQIFDAKSTYPVSANPALARSVASAFNDTTTKIFLSGSEVEDIVFPEMIPARLVSGSADTTNGTPGAPGDTSPFYRDIHHTPYNKRLVAPGKIRSGLSHKETELLNLATRSSPITISQDTIYLGGAVTPYDDSNPLINEVSTIAVNADVYPGLQQRLADHVAIVIDLDPTSDSTIGVERDEAGISTGRVTSIAYFNFDTKKWETKGKNNDFIVQGPITVSTGSKSFQPDEIYNKNAHVASLAWKVFDDTSIAFAGTSGFSIFYDQGIQKGLDPLAQRGAPTSNYGFPIHQKYEAADPQLIDMSKYITAPFLLERVSFEFGAAIEDSGPHSLGYAAPTLSESQSLSFGQVAIGAKNFSDAPQYKNNVQQTRAPFINGSVLHPVSSYDNASGLRVDGHGFMSSSATDLNAIVAPDSSNQFKLKRRPSTLVVSPAGLLPNSVSHQSIFLKTSIGPRGYGSSQTHDQRKSKSQEAAISYIPVLAGGVNGVVTGSADKYLASTATGIGPHMALEPNIQDDPSDRYAKMLSAFDTTEGGPKSASGTPFWRADSFFLLRQSSVKRSPIPMTYSVIGGSDAGMVPLAPYQGTLQPYQRTVNGAFLSGSVRYTLRNFGKNIQPDLVVTSEMFITGSTTREMITYGQMSHFGYTNAYDSVMDTIWDTTQEHTHVSGSHNPTFMGQIFKNGADPLRVPLFGQAIKYASYPSFSWSTIPANISQPLLSVSAKHSANTSVFSDLPDSYQGQFSYFPTARAAGSAATWDMNVRVNQPSSRNRTSTLTGAPATSGARYHASGSQNNDVNAFNLNSHLNPHTVYTLDTYVGWPNVSDTNKDQIEGKSAALSDYDNKIAVGSGFSAISTPAYVTNGPNYISLTDPFNPGLLKNEEYYRHFKEVGSFTDPDNDKNWLVRGLARDLDVKLEKNTTHQGINPGFSDNWCGFTLMTASTTWRPNESPGRESASLPLQANVYKRQYLNVRKDFKISVPVRTTAPSSIEPPGYSLFTAADPEICYITSNVQGSNTSNRTFYQPQPKLYYQKYGGLISNSGVPPVKGAVWRVAHSAKRYHRRFAASITAGGFVPGPDFSGMGSGRMFVGRASAVDQSLSKVSAPMIFGASPFYSQDVSDKDKGSISWKQLVDTSKRTKLTGSAPAVLKSDGLYILQPSDKLVLGVQPSLPGWNPGSGLPNNRWAKKYGIWDYENSQDGAKALDVDTAGDILTGSMMNLEDQYEPSHGLTMLAGPSRVILYGTFLRDNKHYSNSSTQEIRSDAVHEALHYDNPVLDQFQVNDQSEYGSSYLSSHITGSILKTGDGTTGRRGVAASISTADLTFSGSFQRFTRATENSKIFYDTLLQDPVQISSVSGRVAQHPTGSTAAFSLINMHEPNDFATDLTANFFDLINAAASSQYKYILDGSWKDSFPFESKYAGVSRMATRDMSFIPTGLDGSFIQCLSSPLPNETPTPSSPIYIDNSDGANPEEVGHFSGSVGLQTGGDDVGVQHWNEFKTLGATPLFWTFNPGLAVTGIRNMANTTSVLGDLASSLVNIHTDGQAPVAGAKSLADYRRFTAAMLGYGRQNGKQLDFSYDRFSIKAGTMSENGVYPGYRWSLTEGSAPRYHPAGFKYGYMNCDHLSPSIVHRGDRYGQFRDMLEQRLYSRTYNYGDDYSKVGLADSPVSCIFVDADGSPIDDATKTQCLNLSTIMTSSKPYIEGEVVREIIFNSETVTIE